jgi:hypothetical protein
MGLKKEFAEAVRLVIENLETRPLTWGDPLFHLRNLRLLMFRATQNMLLVSYGVHEEERIVFVRQFRIVPGSPLDKPDQSNGSGDA